jgi:hypothetical protein
MRKKKSVFGISKTPENKKFLKELELKLARIVYSPPPVFDLKVKIDVSQKNTVVGESMIFMNGKLLSNGKGSK